MLFYLSFYFTALQAHAFPNGPINVVVPLAPGDAADISARAMGEEISKVLNTPVVARPLQNIPRGKHGESPAK